MTKRIIISPENPLFIYNPNSNVYVGRRLLKKDERTISAARELENSEVPIERALSEAVLSPLWTKEGNPIEVNTIKGIEALLKKLPSVFLGYNSRLLRKPEYKTYFGWSKIRDHAMHHDMQNVFGELVIDDNNGDYLIASSFDEPIKYIRATEKWLNQPSQCGWWFGVREVLYSSV